MKFVKRGETGNENCWRKRTIFHRLNLNYKIYYGGVSQSFVSRNKLRNPSICEPCFQVSNNRLNIFYAKTMKSRIIDEMSNNLYIQIIMIMAYIECYSI